MATTIDSYSWVPRRTEVKQRGIGETVVQDVRTLATTAPCGKGRVHSEGALRIHYPNLAESVNW